MKTIYLDNAATTPVDKRVLKIMLPYFNQKYGNASEFHSLGRESRFAVEKARQTIAKFFGVDPQEIFFTASATESINLVHKGLIESLANQFKGNKKPEIITSAIEHKAVLESCRHLERQNLAKVTYLPVNSYGEINLDNLKKAINPETVLVSIMYVNNEVGAIEPIAEIGSLIKKINQARDRKIYFHTDATQAVGYLNSRIKHLGVDFLSLTGHKIYAPKGIGVLYKKEGIKITRQTDGGNQENSLRSGTENTPYIVGLGKAFELIQKSKKNEAKRLKVLRNMLITNVLKIPDVKLTGHPKRRAPHIASFIVGGVEGEAMVLSLSDLGIIASTGSACTSGDLKPSHVLTAMGYLAEKSHGSLRFSLGRNTEEKDILYTIKNLPIIIRKFRKMSPTVNL